MVIVLILFLSLIIAKAKIGFWLRNICAKCNYVFQLFVLIALTKHRTLSTLDRKTKGQSGS